MMADMATRGRYMRLHPKPSRSSAMSQPAALDVRRRRALFRAWHRGIKEMDLLLGRYADAHVPRMDEAALAAFEALMTIDDQVLYRWLTGEVAVPDDQNSDTFRAIRAFHALGDL